MPQVSIITVNFNNKSGLERTIKSVSKQVYKDYEHIIIDAASIDGSLEVILENKEKFSYWVSEKDRGIYHGMNKGIVQAKGKYLLFLNSGDYLVNENALDFDINKLDCDILFGYHTTLTKENIIKTIDYSDREIDFGFFVTSTLPHSSSLIKKSLFETYGYYDETFKICADWVFFFQKVIYDKVSLCRLDRTISVFELGGVSTDLGNLELVRNERLRFLNTLMDSQAINYIESIYPEIKKNFYLKKELESQKYSANEYYKKMSQLKGLGFLQKINDFLKYE
jgi:glycosyltransferase involved in cell wall biosynthesis